MSHNEPITRLRDEESSKLLEASILAANEKYFAGNLNGRLRLNDDDFVHYNAPIHYFKNNASGPFSSQRRIRRT